MASVAKVSGAVGSTPTAEMCGPKAKSIIVGVVLAALAGVATYFCLVHGLQLLDTAYTNLATFGAGFLIYCGVTFSFVAVGNILYTSYKILSTDEDAGDVYEYTKKEMKWQIGLSVLAPIAAIPGIIICALGKLGNR